MAEPALIHPSQDLLEGPAGTPMSYWKLVWWRLRRDKVTLMAAAVILGIVLSAVLAPYLAPYNPSQGVFANVSRPLGPQVTYSARMSRAETCSHGSCTVGVSH